MRRFLLYFAVLIFSSVGVAAEQQQPLDAMKQRAEHASEGDRIKLYVEIAQAQLRTVDSLYKAGENDGARKALDDVITYSEKAGSTSGQTRKRMKDTDLSLRKISRRLEEIARGVEFEERPNVKTAIDRLEKTRMELLTRMFQK